MMQHLRSIMRITWMDKVTNKEILEWISLDDNLIRKNLRWTGHLMMMSLDRLPNQILYSQLSSCQRKRGRPRLRFKDTIKRNLKLRDTKTDLLTSLSQPRDNGEQYSSDRSSRCRIATDSMMMIKTHGSEFVVEVYNEPFCHRIRIVLAFWQHRAATAANQTTSEAEHSSC